MMKAAIILSVGRMVMGHVSDDDIGLVQTYRKTSKVTMEELVLELGTEEQAALKAYAELVDASKPLAKIEVGSFKTMNTVPRKANKIVDQSVTYVFQRPFATVPVVTAVMGSRGRHPADVRIFDVTPTQFKVTVVEPKGMDGPHLPEKVNFVAVVPGVYDMHGIRVEAGLTSTKATMGNHRSKFAKEEVSYTWESLNFDFAETPVVLTSLNSASNDGNCFLQGQHVTSPWLSVVQTNVSKKGAQISLERSEVDDNSQVKEEEDIAWIAVSQGLKEFGHIGVEAVYHKKVGGRSGIGLETAAKGIKRWLPTKFKNAISVVSKSSRYGVDGGWARIFQTGNKKICVVVDEDTTRDAERRHMAEDISMVTFSKEFTSCLQTECCVDKSSCSAAAIVAKQKAAMFARVERRVADVKARIVKLQKRLDESAAKSEEMRKQIAAKRLAREQARLADLAAKKLEDIARKRCALSFPGKVKMEKLPADVSSSVLETFDGVQTWWECRLKCCIPSEASASVACSSIIYDADNKTCKTMADSYTVPMLTVPGAPIHAAVYERGEV